MGLWIYLSIFSGLMATSIYSILQMEALLLYWIFCTTYYLLGLTEQDKYTCQNVSRRLAVLGVLLLFTRAEYGILYPLLICLYRYKLSGAARSFLKFYLLYGCLTSIAWISAAACLGVYPLPSTFYSKVIIGKIHLFSENFAATLSQYLVFILNNVFYHWVLGFGWLTWYLISTLGNGINRWGLFFLAAVALVLANGPGNFWWYHENLVSVFLAFLWMTHYGLFRTFIKRISAWTFSRMAVLWIFVICFFGYIFFHNSRFDWDFNSNVKSRAQTYLYVADKFQGQGLYAFPGLAQAYISGIEIGIISYFSGPDFWFYDSGGLLQPRELAQKHGVDSMLRFLYPADALRTSSEEYSYLLGKLQKQLPIYTIWSIDSSEDVEQERRLCGDVYYPDANLCVLTKENR